MKVMIKKNTASVYGYLQIGEVVEVDKQTADRWMEHGIAVVEGYSDKTLKELREIAKVKQIDKYYKLSKDDLLKEVNRC